MARAGAHDRMNEIVISRYITETFDGVKPVETWGVTFFYYNPANGSPDEVYFATLMNGDVDGDRDSNLDRAGVFRLNIGIAKATFQSMFGSHITKRGPGSGVETDFDFSILDQVMPHPVYGRMYWMCVLNPSEETFQSVVRPLLAEAYDLVVGKYERRAARRT
jgi:hypothetical protein